jgi:hypothetical protein
VLVGLGNEAIAEASIASTRKIVSGRVIHKLFCADFCGYLLNKS